MARLLIAILAGISTLYFKTSYGEFVFFAIATNFCGFQSLDAAFKELDRQGRKRRWTNVRDLLDPLVVSKTEHYAIQYKLHGLWPNMEPKNTDGE